MPNKNTKILSRILSLGALITLTLPFVATAQDGATAREQQAAQLRVEVDARIAELDEEYTARATELREQFEASKAELYESADDVFQRSNEETAINRVYPDALTSLQREINSRRNNVYAAQREANGQLIMDGAISPSTWAAISSAPLVGSGIDPGSMGTGSSVGSIGTEAATRDLPEETAPSYQPRVTAGGFRSDGRGPYRVTLRGSNLMPSDPDGVGLRIILDFGRPGRLRPLTPGAANRTETIEIDPDSWSDTRIEGDVVGYGETILAATTRTYELFWKADGYVFVSHVEGTVVPEETACRSPDADGDGYASRACGGRDCDDNDANRFPGNVEVGDPDGYDEDCDPTTLGGPRDDWDNDGFVSNQACNLQSDGRLLCGTDCNDRDGAINPDQRDFCDGIDNNCDGTFDDEGGDTPWYPDEDRDLFGDMNAAPQMRCYFGRPDGWVDNDYDCDDSDPTINPITGHCAPEQ